MNSQKELTEQEQHKVWIANLSDKEFNEWQKSQAGFVIAHFAKLEDMIDETLVRIHKDPHDPDNIYAIGAVIHSLGEMMKEYDYLGAIKLGIGHEGETVILDKIALITRMIKEGAKLYYHYPPT